MKFFSVWYSRINKWHSSRGPDAESHSGHSFTVNCWIPLPITKEWKTIMFYWVPVKFILDYIHETLQHISQIWKLYHIRGNSIFSFCTFVCFKKYSKNKLLQKQNAKDKIDTLFYKTNFKIVVWLIFINCRI